MKRAPAPRDASKVDKPQRDAVTNAAEIAPPGEPAALRHLRTYGKNMGRVHRVHNRQRNFRKWSFAIVPRIHSTAISTRHTNTIVHERNVYTRHRFESHCKSKLSDELGSRATEESIEEATNNCPDTGRNNMGTGGSRPVDSASSVRGIFLSAVKLPAKRRFP